MRLGHVRGVCRSVLIHCGSYLRMSHKLLLHAYRSSTGIQPRAVGVPEAVRAQTPLSETPATLDRKTTATGPIVRVKQKSNPPA